MARSALTRTDTLLRVVSPEGDGYRTALALVSKPSNENAAFGTFVPCEADGYAKPDEEYLDAMLTVYYRAYLRAANAAAPAELRYVTELHSQSLSCRHQERGYRRSDLYAGQVRHGVRYRTH